MAVGAVVALAATGTKGVAEAVLAVAALLAVAAAVAPGMVLGTTLRAIGRGFGSGTLGLAGKAAAADRPIPSARPVARAVVRKAAARIGRFTAFLRGESSDRLVSGLFD
jgi:hypothetical protein